MKNYHFLITSVILFFSFMSISYAVSINVNINPALTGEINYLKYNASNNLVEFDIEYFNSGSFAYKTRIRMDVFENNEKVFTAWSKEHEFFPGNTKNYKLYWFVNKEGNFTVTPRIYFAKEIIPLEDIVIEKHHITETESIFDIKNFKVYENRMTFTLNTSKSAKNIKIIPTKFIPGWIIEQAELTSLGPGEKKQISLFYEPTVWSSRDINIAIASDNGKYYTEKTLKMRKQKSRLALLRELLITYFLFRLI